MEKKSKMPMIYGYLVLLVAVITFIICVATLVNAILDLGDPLYAANRYNRPSLASFENYKMDVMKSSDKEVTYAPEDATLKAMFEAEKNDAIKKVKHSSTRSMYVSVILIIISIVLFITHFMWIRRMGKTSSE